MKEEETEGDGAEERGIGISGEEEGKEEEGGSWVRGRSFAEVVGKAESGKPKKSGDCVGGVVPEAPVVSLASSSSGMVTL